MPGDGLSELQLPEHESHFHEVSPYRREIVAVAVDCRCSDPTSLGFARGALVSAG